MDLSISQVQNVLRTYQKQVREERVKAILGIREEASKWSDRVDISPEGRTRLQEESRQGQDTDTPRTR